MAVENFRVESWGFNANAVPYSLAWERQKRTHELVASGQMPSAVALLEHEAVYTAGKLTKPEDLPRNGETVVKTDRGGRITWHGPGQLVAYPIVKLDDPLNVTSFVRQLEDLLIRVCAHFGVKGYRIPARSGVWVLAANGPEKVAAIGLRVSKGVTMHGFALNCDCDLSAFDQINPCGITDAGVTSLSIAAGKPVTVEDAAEVVRSLIESGALSPRPTKAPRKLLRIEAKNAQTPIERKPNWIKAKVNLGDEFQRIHALVSRENLHTVCQQAGCPNIYECWEANEATFLIGGSTCTRRCDFCKIDSGKPTEVDLGEPLRVAQSVKKMGLVYATVTGVARDDLPDDGAWLYAETVRQIRALSPGCGVELLIPDFRERDQALGQVFAARPDVLAHNLETVQRLFGRIRLGFTYSGSLRVLAQAKAAGLITKSNLILGLGETDDEIYEALADLRSVDCDLLTITQYLRPSVNHHPVVRWVETAQFEHLKQAALNLGFIGVMSGPLVRSSYKAGELWRTALGPSAAANGEVVLTGG
jgi:lipoic acid synthetase